VKGYIDICSTGYHFLGASAITFLSFSVVPLSIAQRRTRTVSCGKNWPTKRL